MDKAKKGGKAVATKDAKPKSAAKGDEKRGRKASKSKSTTRVSKSKGDKKRTSKGRGSMSKGSKNLSESTLCLY